MSKKWFLFSILLSALIAGWVSPIAADKKDEQVVISISAVGDCTIGSFPEVPEGKSFFDVFNKNKKDYKYFFKNAKALKNDDLSVINLEGTFTTATKKASKKWRFKSEPEFINVLKEARIEAAVISNNHIYDYEKQGFSDTVKTLQRSSIFPVGEGYKPIYKVKGKKIALLSYNVLSSVKTVEEELEKDINAVSKTADLIIVSFHWGVEYTYDPISIQKKLGRKAVDLGADLILGTHPHVLQGIEYYKNRYIVYSLGNFVFGGNEIMYDEKHKDHDTMLFSQKFTFKDDKLLPEECRISFYKQSEDSLYNDYCPVALEKPEALRVRDKLLKISKNLQYGLKSIKLN